MGLTLIDGSGLAKSTRESIRCKVDELKGKGIIPGLAVVLVGDDAASQIYVRGKEKACQEVGFHSEIHRLAGDTTQEQLLALVEQLNQDKNIHGILVQLPLPAHLDEKLVINAISKDKDVDGFHLLSAGALMVGEKAFQPCTPKGCMELIKTTGIDLTGKKAVVVGRSNIVGKPIALMLLQANATVTICHSKTVNLKEELLGADVVVAAVGVANLITGDMIKPGAVVIDVGMNRLDNGKLAGDVDRASLEEVDCWLTPVPGGVGPMTIAMLMANTLEAAENMMG